MLEAVIFDFDGVIVDTEPLHYAAFQDVLEPLGLTYSWDEYVEGFIGFDDRDALREGFQRRGRTLDEKDLPDLMQRKAHAFLERVDQLEDLEPYEGVLELLSSIKGECPLGLCSGAVRSDILPILDRLQFNGFFEVMVTADDVHSSKPDPACYTMALELLGGCHSTSFDPSRCIAIEDTPTGLAAAMGAGLKVLGVSNTHPAEQLHEADWRVDTLAGLQLSNLRDWIG